MLAVEEQGTQGKRLVVRCVKRAVDAFKGAQELWRDRVSKRWPPMRTWQLIPVRHTQLRAQPCNNLTHCAGRPWLPALEAELAIQGIARGGAAARMPTRGVIVGFVGTVSTVSAVSAGVIIDEIDIIAIVVILKRVETNARHSARHGAWHGTRHCLQLGAWHDAQLDAQLLRLRRFARCEPMCRRIKAGSVGVCREWRCAHGG